MTDKLREAAQQALTTIEAAIITLAAVNEQGKITDTIWVSEFETLFDFLGSEADALRAALAENDVQQEIEAALAQPEQKPVAAQHRFRHPEKTMPDWSKWQECKVSNRPAWEIDSQGYEVEYRNLYTPPLEQERREWQGLTNEEISAISKSIPGETDLWAGKRLFARAIEAKLKEKNT
jgi:hypothetical protein